jgi:peptide/nickel transport system permease protein
MPGDPADRLDSPAVPAEQAERNRRALGLDRPVGVQLLRRLASYASGDLGVSFTRKRPVDSVLVDALPSTALLGSAALLLAYGIGLPLALLLVALPARWRRRADRGLLALAVTPRFWLGVMLIAGSIVCATSCFRRWLSDFRRRAWSAATSSR